MRNPSELKSIKNISLLRQQMEAQAAAQKLAAQHAAQAAMRGLGQQAGQPMKMEADENEPTDLTLDAEEKALRMRERLERERSNGHAGHAGEARDDPREREDHEPRQQFDFRHLIPQFPIKTEWKFRLTKKIKFVKWYKKQTILRKIRVKKVAFFWKASYLRSDIMWHCCQIIPLSKNVHTKIPAQFTRLYP